MDTETANRIPVTKPFLPPRQEYEALLREVWKRNWLTNDGPLVRQLEKELEEYLEVPYVNYVSNGTIALQIAIKALDLKGEIITTPFSYVATTSSIVWEGVTPVFVDIDSDTLNINPNLIEKAITGNTTAILATHVFGNPCDIDAIQEIAGKHNLKVIYDAAHCFGTKYRDKSIFSYGNISTASFHATKLYQTIEGGAVITDNSKLSECVSYMRNFGHAGPENFEGVGINGKNSEVHAAMGICNFKYIDEVLARRKEQWERYDQLLQETRLKRQKLQSHSAYNYSYFPIVFENEEIMLDIKKNLEDSDIYPRRYFYPSLNKLEYVAKWKSPISEDISKKILCLPLYHYLSSESIDSICKIILYNLKSHK